MNCYYFFIIIDLVFSLRIIYQCVCSFFICFIQTGKYICCTYIHY